MGIRGCVRYLFLFILTVTVLWTLPAFADETSCDGSQCYTVDPGSVPAEQGTDSERECQTVTDYANEFTSKCFTCSLFANLMGAVQKISKSAFEATGDALIELLCIAFLIYVAYVTLISVASPEMQKLSKYLTTLILQGAKVAITILILQNPTFLYSKLLTPILESSVDFGMSLTGTNAEKAAETGKKYIGSLDPSNEYFSVRTAQVMIGAVENFSNGATTMPAIGRGFICYAWKDLGWFFRMNVIPRIGMLTEGALLYISGVGIWLAIGFYMLDCAIELGIVCALMAFFVACWPFKMTTGYTKIGWNMFLNVFFNFVMMGIIVATIVGISGQAMSVGTPQEQLISLVNSDSIEGLEDAIKIGGLQMLMVIVCCFMCFKLPGEAGRLASKFASGAQLGGLGGDLGGTAASFATKATIGDALGGRGGQPGSIGGGLGLAMKGAKAWGKSVGENTGLTAGAQHLGNKAKGAAKNAARKAGQAVKGAFGGGSSAEESSNQDQITNGFNQDR